MQAAEETPVAVARAVAPRYVEAGAFDAATLVSSESRLTRFLAGLPGVDQVGLRGARGALAKRSIKKAAKLRALEARDPMIDLTTLEGEDTPGKVRRSAQGECAPSPATRPCPSVAAICVYPNLVATAGARSPARGVAWPPSRRRSPRGRARSTSSSPTCGAPSRSAPTRSTW